MSEPRRRFIGQPYKRKCPQCDSAGFKLVRDSWATGHVFRCNHCAHEWIESSGRASDRRDVISRAYEREYWEA